MTVIFKIVNLKLKYKNKHFLAVYLEFRVTYMHISGDPNFLPEVTVDRFI